VGRDGLAMIFDMRLGRFRSVVHCMFVVTACQVRMMCCCLMFARFVVFCGFLVVSCRVFVMLCCFQNWSKL
jgi:hypothetical protein